MPFSSPLQGLRKEKPKDDRLLQAIVNPECPHYVDMPTHRAFTDQVADFKTFVLEGQCTMCGKRLSMSETISRKDLLFDQALARNVKDMLYVKYMKQWGPRRGRYRNEPGANMPPARVRPPHMGPGSS